MSTKKHQVTPDKENSTYRAVSLILARIAQRSCPTVSTIVSKDAVTHVLRCPVGECCCKFCIRSDIITLSPELVTCLTRRVVGRVPAL